MENNPAVARARWAAPREVARQSPAFALASGPRKTMFFEEKRCALVLPEPEKQGVRTGGSIAPAPARREAVLTPCAVPAAFDLARGLAVGMWEPVSPFARLPSASAISTARGGRATNGSDSGRAPVLSLQAARARSARRVEWAKSPNGLSPQK